MADLRKVRNTYYARVRKWDGLKQIEKSIPLLTKSKVDAEARFKIVQKRENDIKDGYEIKFPWQNNKGENKIIVKTIFDSIDAYIVYIKRKGGRDSTVVRTKYALKHLISFFGPEFQSRKLNTKNISNFIDYLLTVLSPVGVNIVLTRLIGLINWLYKYEEEIERLPIIEKVSVVENPPRYLKETDMGTIRKGEFVDEKGITIKLYKLIKDYNHYNDVFKLYWETGARLCELIDGELDGNWVTVFGENSKTGIPREIEIQDYHIPILIDLQTRYKKKECKSKTFTNRYSKNFKKIAIAIGRGDLHFHNLRDTYAVIRYLETNDIYLVSKELGHKNIKMTLKYANFSIRKLKRDFPSIDVFVKPSHRKYLIRETDIRETCEV